MNEPIVASLDAKQLRVCRRAALGDLLDDRQHGDLIRIGKKKTAQRRGHLLQFLRRIRLTQPFGERHRRHLTDGVGRRVSSGEPVAPNQR